MATLTNSTAFTIGAQSTAVADVDLSVLPVAAVGEGRGRLIHPTLGTYDYDAKPNSWTNMDGDAIIAPVWQNSKTLSSGQNTLWTGSIKDTVCIETWSAPGGISMSMGQVRVLISFYQNPPDPADDYVQWWPSYISTNGYDVVIKNLTIGGRDIKFTDISISGYMDLPVELTLQLVGNAA